MKLEVPYSELSFHFSRASGAGGQNVNKVNTRATLEWDLAGSPSIPLDVKERFIQNYPRFLVGGLVVIHSQKNRTQLANKNDCIRKLHELLDSVRLPPKPRKPTKPSAAIKKKRLDSKRHQSQKKSQRTKNFY